MAQIDKTKTLSKYVSKTNIKNIHSRIERNETIYGVEPGEYKSWERK